MSDPAPNTRRKAARERLDGLVSTASASFTEQRSKGGLAAVAADIYERDRDAFGSVLGAALAVRLFLFFVYAVVALVGLLNILHLQELIEAASNASATGELAQSISDASRVSGQAGIALFALGVFLTLWSGRSLTRVLAATSAAAWALPAREAKATVRVVGTLSSLLVLLVFGLVVIGRLRTAFDGLAVVGLSFASVAVLMGVGWFLVTWALPRGTSDPGALLPGAALVGLCFATANWFMAAYLPGKVERSSQLGIAAYSVALLGYLFVVGRLMAASFIIDAVVFQRFGSLSHAVFSLPGVRRVPRRWPRVARFFDLNDDPVEGDEGK